jgi:hypothetical protein
VAVVYQHDTNFGIGQITFLEQFLHYFLNLLAVEFNFPLEAANLYFHFVLYLLPDIQSGGGKFPLGYAQNWFQFFANRLWLKGIRPVVRLQI